MSGTKSFSPDQVQVYAGTPPDDLQGSMSVLMRTNKYYTDGTLKQAKVTYVVTREWGRAAVEAGWAEDASSVLPMPDTPVLTQLQDTATMNTCVLMGHSRLANGFVGNPVTFYTYQSPVVPLNFLLGRRLTYVANFSVTSATVKNVIDLQFPQLQALAVPPKYVMLEVGYNDWGTIQTVEDVIGLYRGLVASIQALGCTVIAFTDLGGTTLTASAQIRQQTFNAYLTALAGTLPRFHVIDGASLVQGNIADSSVGSMHSTMRQTDGVHPNANGSMAIAREAFRVLDSVIPIVPNTAASAGPFSQLITNPNLDGDNASGAGGWTAGAGNTGSGPNNSTGSRTGTASAVFSMVDRSAAIVPSMRPGKLLNIAFTGGGALDTVLFTPAGSQNMRILNWSFTGLPLNFRIRPTVPNGVHYLVTTSGTTANVPDPTGSWTTEIGATVVDGSVTYTVVPAIDVGDTVQFAVECFGADLVGGVVLQARLQFYTVTSGLLGTFTGGFTSSGVNTATYLPTQQVLYTPPALIPATTAIITAHLIVVGAAAATATVQVANCELRKIG